MSYSLTHGNVGADYEPWQNASTSDETLLTVADDWKGRRARTVNGGRTAHTDRGSSDSRAARLRIWASGSPKEEFDAVLDELERLYQPQQTIVELKNIT